MTDESTITRGDCIKKHSNSNDSFRKKMTYENKQILRKKVSFTKVRLKLNKIANIFPIHVLFTMLIETTGQMYFYLHTNEFGAN